MQSAGRIAAKVHSASGFRASAAGGEGELPPGAPVYTLLEIPGHGRLCTEPRPAGAAPDDPTLWEQELTFEVGPSPEESPRLHAALYAVTPGEAGTDDFLCGGSMSLAHLGEVGEQHNVRVPMVTAAGAHRADLSLDLRYFHSRSAGRQRDDQGREYIDAELATAARLLNERSSRSPTASPRAGSPRLKPPAHDPPVPAIEAHVRTTLVGEQ